MTDCRLQSLLSILLLDRIDLIQGESDESRCSSVNFASAKVCAAMYEKEECDRGDWGSPLAILDSKGQPYNLPAGSKGPESLVVRMGCALQVFTTRNCVGDEAFLFIAPWYNVPVHLEVKELDNSLTEKFDKNIKCVRCYCKISAIKSRISSGTTANPMAAFKQVVASTLIGSFYLKTSLN